jgi:uncharacterized repeat protein (TIGR03803 family)
MGQHRVGAVSPGGTVFDMNLDGSGFMVLHSFNGADGANPYDDVVLTEGFLFGTTYRGGAVSRGTVFRLSLPTSLPRLTVGWAGPNICLAWRTNFTGYGLLAKTNLSVDVWSKTTNAHVVMNDQYTVTTQITGIQQISRLSQ